MSMVFRDHIIVMLITLVSPLHSTIFTSAISNGNRWNCNSISSPYALKSASKSTLITSRHQFEPVYKLH